MKLILTFFLFLSICLSIAQLQPPSQKRTLVLIQKSINRANYSQYFHQLQAEGFTLTFRPLEDSKVQLSNYGEYLYDNIIIFANTIIDSGRGVNIDKLAEFLEAGNNLLLATDHQSSVFVNDLVNECGVQIDKEGFQVIDHSNHDVSSNQDHTLIVAENYIEIPVIVGDVKAPILYQGAGLALYKENPLVIPVLRGSPSAYSAKAGTKANSNSPFAGKNLLLVSALQARNNARMIVSGSLELFSNRLFDSSVQKQGSNEVLSRSGNQDFVKSLTRWAFKQQGVLEISDTTYKRVEDRERPGFRIRDNLAFETKVHEWNGKEWVPFLGGGFQIEFVRLDPHVRLTLQHDATGRYFKNFTIPDVYGVFTLRLIHGNTGYSFINWRESVSVRPFRHDEYERFIVTAYPYYLSAFSMMFGFGIFSFLFLYYRSTPAK